MIEYNKDYTYNLAVMTQKQRDNYNHAYRMIKAGMRFDCPREVVEDYITEKDILEGYSE